MNEATARTIADLVNTTPYRGGEVMDTDKLRELLDKRDRLDEEIVALVTGKEKKPVKCSNCGGESHTARSCPQKQT